MAWFLQLLSLEKNQTTVAKTLMLQEFLGETSHNGISLPAHLFRER
jgi:hypothetical protein